MEENYKDLILLIKSSQYQEVNNIISKGNIDISKLSLTVCSCCNAKEIYEFSKMCKKVYLVRLANSIILKKDPFYIYMFAKNIEYAPIDVLAKGIIDIKNPMWIYWFAIDVEDAPIDLLATALYEIGENKLADAIYREKTKGKGRAII